MRLFKEIPPREVWAGWISSSVEAYNMAIYSFIAPLLAKFIFLQRPTDNAIFFSYSLVLIASCFIYPAGAIYYGFLGDRQGRQKTCIYSTLGLGIATGLIGFISLDSQGDSVWIYLLILIGAQHFFSGGEYHGSIVFSLEHAQEKQSGLISAFSCLFAVFGLASANGLATLALITEEELWIRVCFFVGAAGGLLSYLLKKYCRETPAFIALAQNVQTQIKGIDFIKSEWQKIGTTVAVLSFFMVSYTFIFIVLPLIPFDTSHTQHFDTFKSLIVYGVTLVLSGWVSDRIGIQKVLLTGICLFSVTIIPLCHLCSNLQILQMALTVCASLVIGPIHSWMLQQFEVKQRCRGIFISSAIATSIFGGSTTPICLMLFEWFQSLMICCIYPLTIALGSFACLLSYKKSKKVLA